jgi:hemoglobin
LDGLGALMMESTISMYEKFGGEEGIAKVVGKFYELVFSDPTINHFFHNIKMEKLLLHQTRFISFALGGPNKYTGKTMATAHKGMNLQPAHFEAVAKHLHEALAYYRVNDKEINNVLQLIGSLKDDVLFK